MSRPRGTSGRRKKTRRGAPPRTDSLSSASILDYKTRHHLTYAQLAVEVNINQETLMRLVHGQEPSFLTLKRLAKFFQWTPAEMAIATLYEEHE